MYFLGLEVEVRLNVRSCIMDTNPESNSPEHHPGVIFMAPAFGLTVTCYI